jgi:2,4-dienoyl-CoA reductase-like NADH-dependent reductase (Old Yellow Enzyme family)
MLKFMTRPSSISLAHLNATVKSGRVSFIAVRGFSNATGHVIDLAQNTGNLIAFGCTFIANPNLTEHLRNEWEFNKYNGPTCYSYDL